MSTIASTCTFFFHYALSLLCIGVLFFMIVAVESKPPSKPIISFCAGYYHACAVFDNKKAKCWGPTTPSGQSYPGNELGGSLTTIGDLMPYVDLGPNLNIEQVACGSAQTCFRLDTGAMKCAGSNSFGAVGIGVQDNSITKNTGYDGVTLPFVNVGTGLQILGMALGEEHSCVVVTGGKVKCFGRNDVGQLGLGNTTHRGRSPSDMGDNLPFIDLGTNVQVASVHTGPSAYHNCAILSAPAASLQKIKCWGSGESYELGYGDLTIRGDGFGEMGDNLPLVDFGSESKVKQIVMGSSYTCVLLLNDAIKCYGQSSYGNFGSGSTADISSTGDSMPSVTIDSGKTVAMIGTGDWHTCIVYNDAITMKCVGDNGLGQLGQGDTTNRGESPTRMIPSIPAIDLGTGSLKISSVNAGGSFTCVVFEDGSIKCFGQNLFSVLAIGFRNNPYNAMGNGAGEMGTNLPFAELFSPTQSPTLPTQSPTNHPTLTPSNSPTKKPTNHPTLSPTRTPTKRPTLSPTLTPSHSPTTPTTKIPTTQQPTTSPTIKSDNLAIGIGVGIAVPLVLITFAGFFWMRYKSRSIESKDIMVAEVVEGYHAPIVIAPSQRTVLTESPTPIIQKKYLAFLSHFKSETGTVASLISTESEKQLKKRKIKKLEVFLDSNNLTDLNELRSQVQKTKVMVALLSKSYLTRPWCLIELYYALEFGIPIVAVDIDGSGYDYANAEAYLENLSKETLEIVNPGASKEFIKLGIDIQKLGQNLVEVLPKKIAQRYDPTSPAGVREAQLDYIFENILANANRV